jgi:hypothetical protein
VAVLADRSGTSHVDCRSDQKTDLATTRLTTGIEADVDRRNSKRAPSEDVD